MRELQQIEREHPELITPDSPTLRVGGKPREGFQKVPHSSPMLSLDNALTPDELRAFDSRVRELLKGADYRYVAELKMDGLSMAARYREDLFNHAITRGDGSIGEDVTENARTIRSLPLRVKSKAAFEARGEVVFNQRLSSDSTWSGRRRACPVSPIRAMRRRDLCAFWNRASRLRVVSITTPISHWMKTESTLR